MANKSRKPGNKADKANKDMATNKKSNLAKAQDRAASMQKKRKTQQPKQKKEKGGFINYIRGVKLEMKKVVWPTRKELSSFTVVVLAACVAFALLFWGVDSGVLAAIKAICF